MEQYIGKKLDEERALYGLNGALVDQCRFEGPKDGESALKECTDITVSNCDFLLRYPLWHVTNVRMSDCRMTETCRAALWYDRDISIDRCVMNGIKALRECDNVTITGGSANSTEFGWLCRKVDLQDFELTSEYPFFHTHDMQIENLRMKGKYSFQYVKNVTIRNSVLDTKDAFWHSENVTVIDSVVKGEYLAWYSTGLKLIRCQIIGTQPLCYCKGLVLEDCTMQSTDLSFENSEVEATVKGDIISIKNPIKGFVRADNIGQIIRDEHLRPNSHCLVTTKEGETLIS